LEAAERAFSVNRVGELSPELGVVDHRDEALHPAVLLAGRDRIDPEVVRVGADAGVHLRVGDSVDDTKHFACGQVQVAVNLGCVVLKSILQRLPIHGDLPQWCRRMTVVTHVFSLPKASVSGLSQVPEWARPWARGRAFFTRISMQAKDANGL